jgi:hypothetical protein
LTGVWGCAPVSLSSSPPQAAFHRKSDSLPGLKGKKTFYENPIIGEYGVLLAYYLLKSDKERIKNHNFSAVVFFFRVRLFGL